MNQQETVDIGEGDNLPNEITCAEGCCPPTTAEKVFIGTGSLVMAVVLVFLLVGLLERYYVKTDRSALLGRNLGISLSLFLSTAGLAIIAYSVTGCWLPTFTFIIGFFGVVWLIHLIYTLAVVGK